MGQCSGYANPSSIRCEWNYWLYHILASDPSNSSAKLLTHVSLVCSPGRKQASSPKPLDAKRFWRAVPYIHNIYSRWGRGGRIPQQCRNYIAMLVAMFVNEYSTVTNYYRSNGHCAVRERPHATEASISFLRYILHVGESCSGIGCRGLKCLVVVRARPQCRGHRVFPSGSEGAACPSIHVIDYGDECVE